MGAENMGSTIEKCEELYQKLGAAIKQASEQRPSSFFGPHNAEESSCFNVQGDNYSRGLLYVESCGFSSYQRIELASLGAIRDSLQVFREWLCFLERLQSQQHVERYAALLRFEQSRQFLVKKLVEHNGRDLPVIKDTLEFARSECEAANLGSQASFLCGESRPLQKTHVNQRMKFPEGLLSFLSSSIQLVRKPLNLQNAAGIMVRIGVAAAGMLLALQLHQRSQQSLKMHQMTRTIVRKEDRSFRGREQQIRSGRMDVCCGRG